MNYEQQVKKVFSSGVNSHFELKWTGKDGNALCSNIRLTAERDLSGEIVTVLAVGHDITELTKSREELQNKELAKSRFLAAAGHDLRQPLAAASLFIDALKLTDISVEQDRILERLDNTMSTFNELLGALLNISKLDAGIVNPEYTNIPLSEIINWLEQSFAQLTLKKNLGFKLYFSMKEPLSLHSDIDLLKSVLANLVSNALKYTSSGAILISARKRGDAVLLQVWDTGIGIARENIERIFDEFYQVNNQQRDRASGLGLGLAIAKRAILLLGGEISCRSQPGRGSVFGFSLPLSYSSNIAKPFQESSVAESSLKLFAKGKQFIVLEDDALVAQAMISLLELMGAKVQRFTCAEEALQDPFITQADYCIADYMLGGKQNGLQFLDQLQRKMDHPLKGVLMTGDTSPAFIRESANCDWPVLHKPVTFSRLLQSLTQRRVL